MSELVASSGNVRLAEERDEAFLYGVFCSLWEREVAKMPDSRMVHHFLRIQYTTQESRFRTRFPTLSRYVLQDEHGKDAGRLFLHPEPEIVHLVDLTLLPAFRGRGLATATLRDVMAQAQGRGQTVSLRVDRRSAPAAHLCHKLGFDLVTLDDQDGYYEWQPASV